MKETIKKLVDLINERFDVGVDAVTETAIEDTIAELSDAAYARGVRDGRVAGYAACYNRYNPD